MAHRVLVKRLTELYDPFSALRFFPRKGEVERAKPVSKHEPDYGKRTRKYHAGRIKFFIDILAQGGKINPISVDNQCEGGHIYPEPTLLDGHHRLAAAELHGEKWISVSYGGRLDLLRYLQGRRKTCPQG